MLSTLLGRRGVFSRRSLLASGVGGVALVLVTPHAAFASVASTPDDTAQVAGNVYAVAQVGDRTIVGGKFTSVGGKARANIAAIRSDGTVDPTFNPGANGTVYSIAATADGSRIFLGGLFTQAGGLARANLAAVDGVTGAAVTSWQADTAGTNPEVKSIAVHADRLYVGGKFGTIDGTSRLRLAAVDTGSGDVVTSFRPRPAGGVRAIVLSPDGSTLFAGGGFTKLGGQSRPEHAGEVYTSNGDATPFNPSESGGNIVSVGLSPDGERFFYGTDNNTIFAYDVHVSNNPVWLDKMSGNTQAIAVSDTEMYIGGHFSQSTTYKVKRAFFASLHPEDGTLTTWDPSPTGGKMGVWALSITPDHLLAGGVFTAFGTQRQRGFARFSGTP
jgi:WD40 repeat protein